MRDPKLLCATSSLTLCLLACSASGGGDDGGAEAGSTNAADDTAGPPEGGAAPTGSVDGSGDGAPTSDDGSDPTGDATGDTGDPPVGACGEVVTFDAGLRPTSERHVAPGGDDGGGCGSADSPCATLEGALAGIAPGTAVRIHPGTYGGGAYIAGLAGTADAPIWIGGVAGEAAPVFEGGDVAFQLSGAHYVVIHDLEVRNMTYDGINIDDGGAVDDPGATHHVVLRDLFIHDIGTGGNNDCLKLSGVNDYVVVGSEFSACGGDSGSAIDQVGCHRGAIAASHFHDLQGNAVQTKGGSSDVETRGNRFEYAGQRAVNMGGSTGFEYFRPPLDPAGINAEARNIRVVANVFVGSMSPVALVGCTGCLVANNTMIDPERWVLRVLQETTSVDGSMFAPSGDNTVVNNVVVFSRAQVSTVVNVGSDTAPETFSFAHNLWFAQDDPGQSDPGLPVAEDGGVVGVDPQLADDGSIAAGSPAAGAGTPVEGVGGDYRGRCYGDPPSIGAFEVR